MTSRFEERLASGPVIIGDGGMGALVTSPVPRLRCPEEANLRAPEAVVSLHVGFINAGADLIETNTFGANRRKLAEHFLEDELEQINSTAVKLARQARETVGRDVFVAGSIGPLGEPASARVRHELFAEQATVLEGRGADLFMVETFYDLEELVDAIEGIREVSALPIVALLTFDEGAVTLAGVTAQEAAERLADLDLAAIGANHGAGLLAALAALEEMDSQKPLAALPNIGLASLAGGRVIFPHASPDYFGEFAAHARQLGAKIIGGCCGTTPVEIAAIHAAVEDERAPRSPLVFGERELVVALGEERRETGLSRALSEGEWVVSVQLDPPLGGNIGGLVELSQALKESGLVGFVDVNDNAGARAGMNAVIVSSVIERTAGIERIQHLTTRDYTVMGLEAVLFGAHAEGVRNILAVTGDPPEVGDYPGSRGVYEVDATADDLGLEIERYHKKIEAGAQFAMSQLVFDLAHLERFFDRFGGPSPIPILLGVCPVWSYRFAVRLDNELPGIIVPESLQRALEAAGPNALDVGMAHARELLDAARERVAGVYLVAPFRKPLRVLALI